MPVDHDLPHVDMGKKPGEGRTCTVEYLNYNVLDEHGWGLDDTDLFQKAAETDLGEENHGTFDMDENEYVLKAAEDEGYDWPFSCRESSCATCAAIVKEGKIDMTMNNILSDEEIEERNVRLTCVGKPNTDEIKLVYNARYLDSLQGRAHF
jgi:2Fe-2S type ferredoxin